ncbi:hypothetical protein F5X96DRAFT_251517 [Biscogniauxia mediterranea]|nr:hypothetical protein F5X96DRAFT_251517 [Biscogniauxia mediterranea]
MHLALVEMHKCEVYTTRDPVSLMEWWRWMGRPCRLGCVQSLWEMYAAEIVILDKLGKDRVDAFFSFLSFSLFDSFFFILLRLPLFSLPSALLLIESQSRGTRPDRVQMMYRRGGGEGGEGKGEKVIVKIPGILLALAHVRCWSWCLVLELVCTATGKNEQQPAWYDDNKTGRACGASLEGDPCKAAAGSDHAGAHGSQGLLERGPRGR